MLDDFIAFENSADTTINIAGLFEQSRGKAIDITVTNSNPDLATATLDGNMLTISYMPNSLGEVTIGLIASSRGEQVAEGFTIRVVEPSIYEQTNPIISSLPSQFFTDFNALAQSADDFTVPTGDTWSIERILVFGGANGPAVLDNATVVIYEDNGGVPGAEVYNSGAIIPVSESTDANMNLLLPEAVSLGSGQYWLSVYANLAFTPNGTQWFWGSQALAVGANTQFRDQANLFGTGAVDWSSASVVFGRPPLDQVFQIFGEIGSASTATDPSSEAASTVPLTGLNAKITTQAWPNPSTDRFSFNFEGVDNSQPISLTVYDIYGNQVYQVSDLDTNRAHTWDASKLANGMYIVKINGAAFNKNFRILKR